MEFASLRSWGTYWALEGVLGYLRGREEPPCDQVQCGREGGREEERRWERTSAPEGGLGEGRGSYAQRGPLSARGSAGTERDLQGIGGLEGNAASISPTHLGPGEPAGVLGLKPHPPGPPPAVQILVLSHPPPGPLLATWVPGPEPRLLQSLPVGPGSLSAAPNRVSSGHVDPGRPSTAPSEDSSSCVGPYTSMCALDQLQEQTLVSRTHTEVELT